MRVRVAGPLLTTPLHCSTFSLSSIPLSHPPPPLLLLGSYYIPHADLKTDDHPPDSTTHVIYLSACRVLIITTQIHTHISTHTFISFSFYHSRAVSFIRLTHSYFTTDYSFIWLHLCYLIYTTTEQQLRCTTV